MIEIFKAGVEFVFGVLEKMGGATITALVVGVPIALAVGHLVWWIRRPAAWQRVAKATGFRYHDSKASLPRDLAHLQSLSSAPGGVRCLNVLTRDVDGVWECVLDLSTGLRQKGATRTRTVYIARVKGLQLPPFHLRRTRRRKAVTVGGFEDDREFARLFTLETIDEESVRRLFDARVREQFKRLTDQCRELEKRSNRGLTKLIIRLTTSVGDFEAECAGDSLAIHLSRYIQPGGVPELVKLAENTLAVLRQAKTAVT